jgi:hypothetical protein
MKMTGATLVILIPPLMARLNAAGPLSLDEECTNSGQ